MRDLTPLQELRKSRGYTQQDVATFLGITKATVSKYEKGQRRMSIATAKKLSDFFNVDFTFFLENYGGIYEEKKVDAEVEEMRAEERKHWQKVLFTKPLRRISDLLDELNPEGQKKAIERVEELTEIPKYQR